MRKYISYYLIISFIVFFVLSCRNKTTEDKYSLSNAVKDSYKSLDSIYPGFVPKIFAKDVISQNNRFEQYCSFSPDGNEFYFSVTDSAWYKSVIIKVNILNPANTEIIDLTESDYQSGQFIDATGKKFFFTSLLYSGGIWHSDIYVAEKKGNHWTNPKRLKEPVNSYICEWHLTLTNEGTMYFASERYHDHELADIYKSVPKNGKYKTVEKLPYTINTSANETDPLIAPDESFLIFASNRPKGADSIVIFTGIYGSLDLDLYISFNLGDNNWTAPKNMESINTDRWEFAPALSPDGKYLFFTRRETFKTLTPSKIYWVDAKIIEQYK